MAGRLQRRNGVLEKQWLYGHQLRIAAELDGSGNLVSRFVYGSRANVPDYVIRGATTYRVFSDYLGSPRVVVNVANASDVPLDLQYEAFGVVSGSGAGWMSQGFAGGLYDADTGLVRFGARDYDPSVGRWISKDPILFWGGDSNLYAYVGNDPINAIDPTGLSKYDKLFGLPKKFWKWFHRQVKQPGDPDLTKDEAKELLEEWKRLKKPGPDNKQPKPPPDEGGPIDDLLDLFPFPPVPTCLLDGSCFCSPEGA